MTALPFDPDSLDNRDPAKITALLDALDPILERFFHPTVRGLARIPEGPALYVANHNAGVLMPDVYILASALFRRRGLVDLPYALAHDLAVCTPAGNKMLCPLGAVRARSNTAERIFAHGSKALVYPGGDLEVMRPFAKRDEIVFGERRGYIKLALKTGVPISPVVTAGAHSGFIVLDDGGRVARALGLPKWARVNVLPTVLSFPWGLTFGFPPPYVPVPTRIYSEVLPPIRFAWTGPEAAEDPKWVEECHQRVVATMQDALTRLARERREIRRQDLRDRASAFLESVSGVLRGETPRADDEVVVEDSLDLPVTPVRPPVPLAAPSRTWLDRAA